MHAHGNNMSPYDSETVYKPVGQKIKSKHTWYIKKNILEKSNQMRDLAFQKTKQNRTKQTIPLKNHKNEDTLKQVYYQHDYIESEEKYQKEINQQNMFSLPYRIL